MPKKPSKPELRCPDCEGQGYYWEEKVKEKDGKRTTSLCTKTCPSCNGRGWIPA